MIPLVVGTIWVSVLYGRAYKPLMQFIALRSVQRGQQYSDEPDLIPTEDGEDDEVVSRVSSNDFAPERNIWASAAGDGRQVNYREARQRFGPSAADEHKTGLRFVNPSLVAPLRGIWIADKNFVPQSADGNGRAPEEAEGEDAV